MCVSSIYTADGLQYTYSDFILFYFYVSADFFNFFNINVFILIGG